MDIKQKIRESGFRQWQVAEKVGINEFTFSRYLRRPKRVSKSLQAKIETALLDLKREGMSRES